MPQDMRSRNSSDGNHMNDGHVAIPVDGVPLLPSEVAGYDKLTTPSGGPDSPNGSSHHGSSHSSRHQQQQQQQHQQLQENEETTSDLMHGINSFWAIVFPVCMTMVIASVVVVNYRNSSIEASMQYVYIYMYISVYLVKEKEGDERLIPFVFIQDVPGVWLVRLEWRRRGADRHVAGERASDHRRDCRAHVRHGAALQV